MPVRQRICRKFYGLAVAIAAAAFVILAPAANEPCSGTMTQSKPQSKADSGDLQNLVASISSKLKQHNVPGALIAIVDREQVIWAGGLGTADLKSERAVDEDTVFPLASITKTLTALAVLRLQMEGRISLDDHVALLAPEIGIKNQWQASDPLRVVNLLEHTGGIADYTNAGFYDLDWPPPTTLLQTFAKYPRPLELQARPSTVYLYSNFGYTIAGYLVEKAAGEGYESYVEGNILRPLGMRNSALRLTPALSTHLAQGYVGKALRPVQYYPSCVAPAAGLISSATDMARLVRMMLNRGTLDGVEIVRPEDIARMEESQTSLAARSGLHYGYGMGDSFEYRRAYRAFGHSGSMDGFLSRYVYLPDLGVGYFYAVNSSSPAGYAASGELDDLLYNYVTARAQAPPKPTIATFDSPARFAGFYQPAAPMTDPFDFRTSLFGGTWISPTQAGLTLRRWRDAPRTILQVGPGIFREPSNPFPSIAFAHDSQGHAVMTGYQGYFERVSPTWPLMRRGLFIAAILGMATAPIAAALWLLVKPHQVSNVIPQVLVSLALLVMLACHRIHQSLSYSELGQATINLGTVGFMLGGWLFAIISLMTLVLAARAIFDRELSLILRLHSLAVSLSCAAITVYLSWWGVIGLRLWDS